MSSLTAQKRQKMNEFKAVTNINSDDIAFYALQKTNWDVTNCISLYFENPDSLLNSHHATNRINGNENNSNNNNNTNTDNSDTEESSLSYYASYIPGLTTYIFPLFSYLGTMIYPYFSSMFSPSSSVSYSEILNEFKQKNSIFCSQRIFNNVRFGELMNSNKCIFIYFNDINSNLCDRFNKNILSDMGVIDYLRLNMECWIGDLRNNDGSQLFSQITHEWNDKRLPFVCIAGVHPSTKKLVLVHRQFVGNITSSTSFIGNILDHGMQRWEQFRLQQIAQRQQSESNRNLREIQDEEYQRALRNQHIMQNEQQQQIFEQNENENENDEKYEKDEKDETKQKDIERKNKIEMAKEKINSLQSLIDNTSNDKLIKIALRLPDGKRVEHVFSNENKIESLFDFASCYELKIDDDFIDDEFELVCSYPKRIFTTNDKYLTLQQCKIVQSAMLFVQQKDV